MSFRGATGGAYKDREGIHGSLLIVDYQRLHLHVGELQPTIRTEARYKDLLHLPVLLPSVRAFLARAEPCTHTRGGLVVVPSFLHTVPGRRLGILPGG